SSSIVMLMSVISTHYDLSRISVGHYTSCKCNQVALAPSVCETALGESKRQCWNEVFGGKNDGSI
ncbi:hypothetical protein, partial [Aeromonas veronii]|uniref:hypothetical protein n=1 Tax=Aeromonas veronii TaxID=654 RepID=UPI003003E226